MDIKDLSTKELEAELRTRADRSTPICPNCRGKWGTYYAFASFRGEILHCHGCCKPVEKCTC
jgi:hypothetical protein